MGLWAASWGRWAPDSRALAPVIQARLTDPRNPTYHPDRSPRTWSLANVDFGALTTGLLTGLREGVEAALIVCIILAYLARTGNGRFAGPIWIGVGAAVLASLTIGIALFVTVGGLPEPYEQVFEGATLVVAAAVVTWMLFWMRRQASSVRGELQAAVARVLDHGGMAGLALLAFTAVLREGLETSIFLVGQVEAAANAGGDGGGPLAVLLGALIGLAVATGLGY